MIRFVSIILTFKTYIIYMQYGSIVCQILCFILSKKDVNTYGCNTHEI